MSFGLKAVLAFAAAAALGAVGAALWVGTRTFEGTVVPDPFDAATHFDEARHHAEALGWTLALSTPRLRAGSQELRFSLASREGVPLEGAEVRVKLSRPGTAWQDVAVAARPDGQGRFVAEVAIPGPGLWDLEIRATRGPDRLAFERRVEVER